MKLPCHSKLESRFIKVSASFDKLAVILCFILGALICPASSCHAQAARTKLSSIIVSHKQQTLTCRMKVDGIFREKINKAIFSGIPVSFTFHVKLYQNRPLWRDKKMIDRQAIHTIKYNALKNNFTVTRTWNNQPQQRTIASFEEARCLMQQTQALDILPLEKLTTGNSYKINVMARLNKSKRPLYLRYFLFFINFNDFKTQWRTIKFTQ